MTRTETQAAIREFISLCDGDYSLGAAERCEALDVAMKSEYATGNVETHDLLLRFARNEFGGMSAWMDSPVILPEDEWL